MAEEEKCPKSKGEAELLLRVLEDAILKSNLILNSFNNNERFNEINTYQKEIFDLLWRMGKIIKPIVAFLISSEQVFLLDSSMAVEKDNAYITINIDKKKTNFKITKQILEALNKLPGYDQISNKLIEIYEVIASNIVGCADTIEVMRNYNSKMNLFKYGLSLVNEAYSLENSGAEQESVKTKYLQALLVIEIVLKAHCELKDLKLSLVENELLIYEIVDKKENPIKDSNELDKEIKAVLNICPLSSNEIKYIGKIINELASKCNKLTKRDSKRK